MSKAALASKETILTLVNQLIQISKLDTLFRDLYIHRARALLTTFFSVGSYFQLKENRAEITWIEKQLRASVEQNNWKRCSELTERLRELRKRTESAARFAEVGETVYERASEVSIDPFSSGLGVFMGATNETVVSSRAEAINILHALERSDPEKRGFYANRASDFGRLTISTVETVKREQRVDAGQLQQIALSALDAGDFSRLDQVLASFAKQPQQKKTDEIELKPAEVAELGDDLLYTFTEQTLSAARELGLAPVRTQSRRQFAYLMPHGWQPSFRQQEIRKWSKEKLAKLTYPADTTNGAREAIEFFLLNPFITSAGTRYRVCLVVEDILLEDFPEPDAKEEVPSPLLNTLKLSSRWGVTRTEIESALLEHGFKVLQELQLDPKLFRLVTIPADLYTQLGPQRGWGQKEMWTHFDGYRLLEGGKLQALAGGDKRFGGTHDVVSFGTEYASGKLFTRFAVVQRKRMTDWQKL